MSDGRSPALTDEETAAITVQAAGPELPGDANDDGVVNFTDLAILRQIGRASCRERV